MTMMTRLPNGAIRYDGCVVDHYRLSVWLGRHLQRTGIKVYPSQVDEVLLEQAIHDDPKILKR
jgi:hypothetical protein